MGTLETHRQRIATAHLADEDRLLSELREQAPFPDELRQAAHERAADLVRSIRADDRPGLMEVFLAEYGLSTSEGIALMCLAEALLRVPDAETVDALIEDKIAPAEWGSHLGHSSSPLVNASTWALMLTGKVLQDGKGMAQVLRGAVKRLGEPVIRVAVGRAIREMGQQFVLGETIESALKRGRGKETQGYTFSYDMLGEAAMTAADSQAFYDAYAHAIEVLAEKRRSDDIRDNPGISIKLSALHPRYEEVQYDRVMEELLPRARELTRQARRAGLGLNIDAEEMNRLELSLDIIERLIRDEELDGWDGFGVVVQAYGKRAGPVLDWLHALAEDADRKIMVRLVKGAYWDTEIKVAQVAGREGFPVFTRKPASDVCFLTCAKKLLGMTDRIYPQFATHNAHSVATILEMADDPKAFEFQRLHGMGEALHDRILANNATRCRIYAPVGPHRDLLAYLVRRLLENGANSSFVNQLLDESVPPETVAADPFAALEGARPNAAVTPPSDLFLPERRNSAGWDLTDRKVRARLDEARAPFAETAWEAAPVLAGDAAGDRTVEVGNPARPDETVGRVTYASEADVAAALDAAEPWQADAAERARVLTRASDLYEDAAGEFFAVTAREAGKTPADAVAELREAVDFLRYYAARARELESGPRGLFACISPWNFPLAIFTGQIAAALAAGNGVLAKPAEQTCLIASVAVRLLHEAGVPKTALQLLPGEGGTVGRALTSDPRIAGVCFTGSIETAQTINRAMADNLPPSVPLIAETGGLNAMVVDSTALPEQAVRDVIVSAFQSAGQRCSALRMLYVQEDIGDSFLEMLYGAMNELRVGDPWAFSTDVGPVIDAEARDGILSHVEAARGDGRLVKELAAPEAGAFVAPLVIRLNSIEELDREVFGPVLHVATYEAERLGEVIETVNAKGYGLTFGIHSRIDDRVAEAIDRAEVGNIYVNRNQIGAIVGSQPFGGEGLSGTGPKAGGPRYVPRFTTAVTPESRNGEGRPVGAAEAQKVISAQPKPRDRPLTTDTLPGPTGESNRLSTFARGLVLCLGPTRADAQAQASMAREAGCPAVVIAPGASGPNAVDGVLSRDALAELRGIAAVALWSGKHDLAAARKALARRDGPIVPLCAEEELATWFIVERHVCIDTTAAGGNAQLLARAS